MSHSLLSPLSPSLSVMRLPPPTESFLNRWPVAGCCCALLVGLQEAAYLSLRVRACFSARVCVRARVHIHKCVRLRKGLTLQMLILVRNCVCVCVFVPVCPAVTPGNRAGNRRGVQPEQVIKKNPCKMVVLWPSLASSG